MQKTDGLLIEVQLKDHNMISSGLGSGLGGIIGSDCTVCFHFLCFVSPLIIIILLISLILSFFYLFSLSMNFFFRCNKVFRDSLQLRLPLEVLEGDGSIFLDLLLLERAFLQAMSF